MEPPLRDHLAKLLHSPVQLLTEYLSVVRLNPGFVLCRQEVFPAELDAPLRDRLSKLLRSPAQRTAFQAALHASNPALITVLELRRAFPPAEDLADRVAALLGLHGGFGSGAGASFKLAANGDLQGGYSNGAAYGAGNGHGHWNGGAAPGKAMSLSKRLTKQLAASANHAPAGAAAASGPLWLPAVCGGFTGRSQEQGAVLASFAQGKRLVIIAGGAGQGKSELALAVGAAMYRSGRAAGGAFFVDLRAATTPDMVVAWCVVSTYVLTYIRTYVWAASSLVRCLYHTSTCNVRSMYVKR